MAKADDKKQRRIDAQMLAALYGADDAELERFRKMRLGRDSAIDDQRLVRARAMLERMVDLLRQDEEDSWHRFGLAAGALDRADARAAEIADEEGAPSRNAESSGRPPTTASPATQAVPQTLDGDESTRDLSGEMAAAADSVPGSAIGPATQRAANLGGALPLPGGPRSSGTERPVADDGDDERDESADDDGDRPTTPPAPPAEVGSQPPQSDALPPRTPNAADAPALAERKPRTPRVASAMGPWAATPPPATMPIGAPPPPVAGPAHQPWGQAYAPGSLPVQPQMPPPMPPSPSQPGLPPPSSHPLTPAQRIGGLAVEPHGPPSSQPLGDSFDPSFAPTQTRDPTVAIARDPTPPLFSAPHVDIGAQDQAPVSEHTPAVGTPLGDDTAAYAPVRPAESAPASPPVGPPDSQTDPRRRLPEPRRPPPPPKRPRRSDSTTQMHRTLPLRDDDQKTMELTFASQAHCFALTVEEFAAHCAERDLSRPNDVRKVNKRYDIASEEARLSLEHAFKLRFERDPSLRSRWEQAYVKYSTLVRQLQRGER